MTRTTLEFASEEDRLAFRRLALHLRDEDRREVEVASGGDPMTDLQVSASLAESVGKSTEAFFIRHDGVPVALFGVRQSPKGSGIVWLLCTKDIGFAARFLLRIAPSLLHGWNARFGRLWNLVDDRNQLHLRWCDAAGFHLIPFSAVGDDGETYTHVIWEKPNV